MLLDERGQPQIVFADRAEKQLKALQRADRDRLIARLEDFVLDTGSTRHDVRPIIGTETLRLRSGDYRAVFEKMPDGRLKVLRVAHRREIYR